MCSCLCAAKLRVQLGLTILDWSLCPRPRINAEANKLKGGGYEDVGFYNARPNLEATLEFFDIENIHAMRKSVQASSGAAQRSALGFTCLRLIQRWYTHPTAGDARHGVRRGQGRRG
jgi:hypothetical protein